MLTDGQGKLWRQNILAGEEWVQLLVLGLHGSFKIIELNTWVYIWAKQQSQLLAYSFLVNKYFAVRNCRANLYNFSETNKE